MITMTVPFSTRICDETRMRHSVEFVGKSMETEILCLEFPNERKAIVE